MADANAPVDVPEVDPALVATGRGKQLPVAAEAEVGARTEPLPTLRGRVIVPEADPIVAAGCGSASVRAEGDLAADDATDDRAPAKVPDGHVPVFVGDREQVPVGARGNPVDRIRMIAEP